MKTELEQRLFKNIFGMSYEDSIALSEAEQELKKLVDDEYEEAVRYAAAHGWKSTRHEKGKELKAKIAEIKERNAIK